MQSRLKRCFTWREYSPRDWPCRPFLFFYRAWMCHISNLWKSKEMDSKYSLAAAGMCGKSVTVTWTWVMAMYPLENSFLAGNWPGSEAVLHMSRIDSDADQRRSLFSTNNGEKRAFWYTTLQEFMFGSCEFRRMNQRRRSTTLLVESDLADHMMHVVWTRTKITWSIVAFTIFF